MGRKTDEIGTWKTVTEVTDQNDTKNAFLLFHFVHLDRDIIIIVIQAYAFRKES